MMAAYSVLMARNANIVPKIGNCEQRCDLAQLLANLQIAVNAIAQERKQSQSKGPFGRFISITYDWWIQRDVQLVAARTILSEVEKLQQSPTDVSKRNNLLIQLRTYCQMNTGGQDGRIFQLVAEAYWQINQKDNEVEMNPISSPAASH